MLAYYGDELPYSVLTNSDYPTLKAHAGGYLNVYGELPFDGSLERFARACDMSARFDIDNQVPAAEYAFDILDNVAQGDGSTVWSIVYDYDGSRIYFKTSRVPEIRYIDTSAFDYSPETPVKILDINAELSGDVTDDFVDYTYEANRELIGASFAGTDFLKDTPKETLDAIANFPEEMGRE
jgi:hypothetical protein